MSPDRTLRRRRLRRLVARLLLAAAVGLALVLATGWLLALHVYGLRDRAGWIDAQRMKLPPLPPSDESGVGPNPYAEAAALVSEPSDGFDGAREWAGAVYRGDREGVAAHLPAIREICERNEPALRRLHEAAMAHSPAGGADAGAADLETHSAWRSLARLAAEAARLAHVEGDDARALGHVEDALALGVDCQSEGGVIDALCGDAVVSITIRPASFLLSEGTLDPARLRQHAARVRAIRLRSAPLWDVVSRGAIDSLSSLDTLAGMDPDEIARQRHESDQRIRSLAAMDSDAWSPAPDEPAGPSLSLRLHVWIQRRSLDASRVWLEDRKARQVEALRDRPLWEVDTFGLDRRAAEDAAARNDMWNRHILSLGSFVAKRQSMEGQLLGLETLACIRAYQLERGRLPEALADLVPAHLPEVPVDPWTGGSLLYRRIGDSFVLYAAGPNKQDDGGILSHPWQDSPDQVLAPPFLGLEEHREGDRWPAG